MADQIKRWCRWTPSHPNGRQRCAALIRSTWTPIDPEQKGGEAIAANDRTRFFRALRSTLVPELRSMGFTGSGTTYRKFVDPVIQVLHIQGSKYGGSCCVNLGIHPSFLPTMLGGPPDPKQAAEVECEFRTRLAGDGESDHWWPYGADDAEAGASATDLLATFRRNGRPYLNGWATFPGPYLAMTVADLERGDHGKLPGRQTGVRAALALARIQRHVGNANLAREFAEWGLSHVGNATTLRASLEMQLA